MKFFLFFTLLFIILINGCTFLESDPGEQVSNIVTTAKGIAVVNFTTDYNLLRINEATTIKLLLENVGDFEAKQLSTILYGEGLLENPASKTYTDNLIPNQQDLHAWTLQVPLRLSQTESTTYTINARIYYNYSFEGARQVGFVSPNYAGGDLPLSVLSEESPLQTTIETRNPIRTLPPETSGGVITSDRTVFTITSVINNVGKGNVDYFNCSILSEPPCRKEGYIEELRLSVPANWQDVTDMSAWDKVNTYEFTGEQGSACPSGWTCAGATSVVDYKANNYETLMIDGTTANAFSTINFPKQEQGIIEWDWYISPEAVAGPDWATRVKFDETSQWVIIYGSQLHYFDSSEAIQNPADYGWGVITDQSLTNAWHHFKVEFDSTSYKVYIDDEFKGIFNWDDNQDGVSSITFFMGKAGANGGPGWVDNIYLSWEQDEEKTYVANYDSLEYYYDLEVDDAGNDCNIIAQRRANCIQANACSENTCKPALDSCKTACDTNFEGKWEKFWCKSQCYNTYLSCLSGSTGACILSCITTHPLIGDCASCSERSTVRCNMISEVLNNLKMVRGNEARAVLQFGKAEVEETEIDIMRVEGTFGYEVDTNDFTNGISLRIQGD